MSLAHEPVYAWMSQFAYQPGVVYSTIVGMTVLSAFGLPVPEEITLVSTGLLAYMGANPQIFPPPYAGAPVINPIEAAVVATLAVFLADFMIYWMGRIWGRRLVTHPRVTRVISKELFQKAETFLKKYGNLATGLLRFLPGIRFPGHLMCGILHFPVWKFALIDGIAVAVSVPTQVLLVARYGEEILTTVRKFKMAAGGVILIGLIIWVAIKLRERARRQPLDPAAEK